MKVVTDDRLLHSMNVCPIVAWCVVFVRQIYLSRVIDVTAVHVFCRWCACQLNSITRTQPSHSLRVTATSSENIPNSYFDPS